MRGGSVLVPCGEEGQGSDRITNALRIIGLDLDAVDEEAGVVADPTVGHDLLRDIGALVDEIVDGVRVGPGRAVDRAYDLSSPAGLMDSGPRMVKAEIPAAELGRPVTNDRNRLVGAVALAGEFRVCLAKDPPGVIGRVQVVED